MAVSTHRWRPYVIVKSGYSFRKTPRKLRATSKKDKKCLLEIKFEKSPYFEGVSSHVPDVFKEVVVAGTKASFIVSAKIAALGSVASARASVAATRRGPKGTSIMSLTRQSSIAFNDTLDDFLEKKLYASEYVEARELKNLTKMKDSVTRCFIISSDPSCVEESVNILELIKLNVDADDWLSFKIIIIDKRFDIKNEILSSGEKAATTKSFTIKSNVVQNVGKDIAEDMDGDDDDDDDDDDDGLLENDSTSTLFDDDEETKMISKMAKSKFRDSRIIIKNKTKTKQPTMDPIERCFLTVMKMLEDNIFSATKGLKELNLQIKNMHKENDSESEDNLSINDHTIKNF